MNRKNIVEAAPEEIITRLGSKATSVFLILQGKVGIYSDLEGKVPLVVEDGPVVLGRGALLGDTEVLCGASSLTTTKALSHVSLHAISGQQVRAELERCSPVVRGLIRTQAGRIRTLLQVLSRIELKAAGAGQIFGTTQTADTAWIDTLLSEAEPD